MAYIAQMKRDNVVAYYLVEGYREEGKVQHRTTYLGRVPPWPREKGWTGLTPKQMTRLKAAAPKIRRQVAAEIGAVRMWPLYKQLGSCRFKEDLQVVLGSVSQNAAAQLLGVPHPTLCKWANGTLCRDRFIWMAVREWAEGLREQRGPRSP